MIKRASESISVRYQRRLIVRRTVLYFPLPFESRDEEMMMQAVAQQAGIDWIDSIIVPTVDGECFKDEETRVQVLVSRFLDMKAVRELRPLEQPVLAVPYHQDPDALGQLMRSIGSGIYFLRPRPDLKSLLLLRSHKQAQALKRDAPRLGPIEGIPENGATVQTPDLGTFLTISLFGSQPDRDKGNQVRAFLDPNIKLLHDGHRRTFAPGEIDRIS